MHPTYPTSNIYCILSSALIISYCAYYGYSIHHADWFKPRSNLYQISKISIYFLILAGSIGLWKLDLTTQNQLVNITKSVRFDGSEIIISEYLRQCWRSKEFFNTMKLPLDLARLITHFYSHECIHLIQRKTGDHWKIPLDKVCECWC